MSVCRVVVLALMLTAACAAGAAELAGTVQWARRVELSTPVSGVVARVAVQPGQRVKKGDLLLALDDRRFRAAVAQARADIERLKAVRDEAEREQGRAQELYDRNLLSIHELDVAKIAFTGAEAQHVAARALLIEAEIDLEYSSVRAPFDAYVVDMKASVGQTVAADLAAVPLVVLADAERVAIIAAIDETRISQIKGGQAIDVEVAGRRAVGRVRRVGLEPVSVSPLGYALEIVVDVAAGTLLRPGQSAKVFLP